MRSRSSWRRRLTIVATVVALVGCAGAGGDETASQGRGAEGTETLDEVVRGHVGSIESFWQRELPAVYGVELDPVRRVSSFHGPDPSTHPRCNGAVGEASLYAGNALYCRIEHAIVYDDRAFDQTRAAHGPLAVGVVLAHEYAHAVQVMTRQEGQPLDLELQADCLSGAWAADQAGSPSGPGDEDLDAAVRVILDGADPAGAPIAARDAHGSPFQRMTAFSEGFQAGTGRCALVQGDDDPAEAEPAAPAATTSRWTGSVTDLTGALDVFWAQAGSTGPRPVVPIGPSRDTSCGRVPGAANAGRAPICIEEGEVRYDDRVLRAAGGRWSVGYPLVAAYGQAQLIDAGSKPTSDDLTLAGDCAAGAFVAAAALAPIDQVRTDARDLDEVVAAMATFDPAQLWPAHGGSVSYLARIEALRRGARDGIDSCPAAMTG